MEPVVSRESRWAHRRAAKAARRRTERQEEVGRLLARRRWSTVSTEADLLSNPALVYIKGDQAGFEIYDHAGRPAGSYRNAELRDSDGGRWLSLRLRSLSKPPFTII